MEFPKQLKNEAFNFIKLRGKDPSINGKDWQKLTHPYTEVEGWFEKGYNYGVLGGRGGLIIIDADTNIVAERVESELPETFTVLTGGGGKHFYYICPEIDKKIVFKDGIDTTTEDKEEVHYGEIITTGSQVVGPGSIHPITRNEYKVIKDLPIVTISKEEVMNAVFPFRNAKKDIPSPIVNTFASPLPKTLFNSFDVDSLKIQDIIPVKHSCVIPHPIHGATNGGNLSLDLEKNLWHCFRCDSGGGAISLLAVMAGIVTCDEVQRGAFRGDKFKQAKDLAEERFGNKQVVTPALPVVCNEYKNEPVLLSELVVPSYDNDWILEGYLSRRKITLLFATWKSGKSTFYNQMLKSIDRKIDFLGIKTNSTRAFVLSEEDLMEWQQRKNLHKYGKDIIVHSQPFTGRPSQAEWQNYIIEKADYCVTNGIDLFVIDTLANLWPVDDENDATKVSEGLIPLRELTKRGLSVLVVHHPKKTVSDIDTAMRGSGALPSFVDAYMMMTRISGGSENQRAIEIRGRSGFSKDKIVIELKDHNTEKEQYVRLGNIGEFTQDSYKEIVMTALKASPFFMTIKEIKKECNLMVDDGVKEISDNQVWRIIRQFGEEGLIEIEPTRHGGGGRGVLAARYKLKE